MEDNTERTPAASWALAAATAYVHNEPVHWAPIRATHQPWGASTKPPHTRPAGRVSVCVCTCCCSCCHGGSVVRKYLKMELVFLCTDSTNKSYSCHTLGRLAGWMAAGNWATEWLTHWAAEYKSRFSSKQILRTCGCITLCRSQWKINHTLTSQSSSNNKSYRKKRDS